MISALLRDGQTGAWLEFQDPVAVLEARAPEDVLPVLARVDAYCRQGGYAAGFLTYEAAAGIDSAYQCHEPAEGRLGLFGLYGPPVVRTSPAHLYNHRGHDRFEEARWTLEESYQDYSRHIARIRQEIGAGNLYQMNYTTRLSGIRVSAERLFEIAGREAAYGALIQLADTAVVSASPELFFRLDGQTLTSSPMKGTIARAADAEEDEKQRRWLLNSEKNRAENLMITDMVRNDVGRIAECGSVRTAPIFELHPLPTVWQMTSTISATTTSTLPEIFEGLFPAASITGAPKIASMSLIKELESSARGIYTGAIGYVGPALHGLAAQFSVGIRTAIIERATGRASYGTGGGIVWDSHPEEEFDEVRLKTRILRQSASPDSPLEGAEILETIGWSPGTGFDYLDAHLDRLGMTARSFNVPVVERDVRSALADAVSGISPAGGGADQRWRVRLCVNAQGLARATAHRIEVNPDLIQALMLSAEPVSADDDSLRLKTTRRGVYERMSASVPAGVEALLWNSSGYVTESCIANLVYKIDGCLFTPPVSDGLLPGVLRGVLIESGELEERSLPVSDLQSVEALYLINALRGWRAATLVSRKAALERAGAEPAQQPER